MDGGMDGLRFRDNGPNGQAGRQAGRQAMHTLNSKSTTDRGREGPRPWWARAAGGHRNEQP